MTTLSRVATTAVAMAALMGGAAQVQAEDKTVSCLVDITRTELGFIIEVGGGRGTLSCQGYDHEFRIGGIQVGGMGISSSKATGVVYNLSDINDFPGTYSGTGGEVTVVGGKGTMDLTNENGIRMVLTVRTSGANVRLGAQGLKITFE